MTRINEEQILRETITALLSLTGSVELCYEDDFDGELIITEHTEWSQIVSEAFACESCTLRVNSKWVFFIWGNGDDGLTCISDYTTSLDDVLQPVFEAVEAIELAMTWRK